MIWTHITLLQSYLSAPPVLYPLPSTNVITYCSGSRLITLYPVTHAVREVGVHGLWQAHLNMGHVQTQIKAQIQKFLLIKWQLVIHKLFPQFVMKHFAVGERSSETALCGGYVSTNQISYKIVWLQLACCWLFEARCVFTKHFYKCGFQMFNEVLLWWEFVNSCLICCVNRGNTFPV